MHLHFCLYCWKPTKCSENCFVTVESTTHYPAMGVYRCCGAFECAVVATIERHEARLERRKHETLERLTSKPLEPSSNDKYASGLFASSFYGLGS